MDIFKKHMTADGFKVGYYPNGEFQKFVNPDKPTYLEWLKAGNETEVIPYEPPPPPPEVPLDVLKQRLYGRINARTSEIILDGMDIKEVRVKLDENRQRDFQALYSRKDDLTYPFLIWEGLEDISIDSADEMKSICESVFDFIYVERLKGKNLKQLVRGYTRKQCENFEDDR